ncbi:MAG: hypothetical protein M1147_05535 [Nitrospirae bacterium]|nr:hypothetical protein [Nitrospirota bacterium]MCL5977581.1 hypothetical protein [Nitrospirota bacterium]
MALLVRVGKIAIYIIAAVALYRQSSSNYLFLWWMLMVSTIISLLTAATVRQAVRDTQFPSSLTAFDIRACEITHNDNWKVIKFWLKANMVMTVITLGLAIWLLLVD